MSLRALCLLRYFSSAILYSALVALSSARNRTLVSLNSLSSSPSSSSRRDFRRLFRFRAHVSINQDSVIFERNERRPIRARRQEREWTRVQIDWTMERLVAIRGISTYMASRRNIARCTRRPTMCLECCWNCWRMTSTELAGNWSSPARVDQAWNPSLNGRVTNYLGNNHPTISFSPRSANTASRHSVINFRDSENFDTPPFSLARDCDERGVAQVSL